MAVNHVHIHLQPGAQHAHGIGDAFLAVHKKVLPHGVYHRVLGGQIHRLGVLDHVLHIVGRDFAVGGNHRMHPAIVKAANVAAGHAKENAADLDIRHLLRLKHGGAQILLHLLGVDDLAFAHPARAGLADADDVQRALGAQLANHDADFGCADFQAGDDVGFVKHFSSDFSRV